MLGMIKNNQGKYEDAVQYYEQSIKINQKFLSPTHSDLATSYTNLGLVYKNMGEYSNALSYYEKALEILIDKKLFLKIILIWQHSYNNIGFGVSVMITWESTQKHFHIMKKHLKF